MARFRTVARNVSANYLGVGVRTIALLTLTPVIIHYLGTAGYAVWILIHTLAFYLRFLDFGLYKALVKYLAGCAATGDVRSANQLIAGALGGLILAGMAAFGLSLILAAYLVPLFRQVPPDLGPQFQLAVILFGLDLLISFPASVCNGIFEGHQRYDILNYTSSGLVALQSAGTIALLLLGHGIISLAVLEILISTLTLTIHLWLVRRLFPQIRWSANFSHFKTWRCVRKYRLWSSLNEILVEGASQLDRLLIPFFLSIALLTPYTLVCTLAALLLVMIEPLTSVLFPLASEQEQKSDYQGMRRTLLLATKAALAITLPATIVLAALGDSLIHLWIDQVEVQPPAGLLPLVLMNFLLTVFFMPATSMLSGMGRLKGVFMFSALETAIAVILVLLSVRRHELIGLAGSYAVANLAVGFSCLLPFACRHLRVSLPVLLLEGLIRPLLAAAPAAMAAWFLTLHGQADTWLELLTQATVIVSVYLAGFYILSLSRAERDFLGSSWRQWRATIPGRAKEAGMQANGTGSQP